MGTILIIDDNETIREGLAHAIRKMGHAILTAPSGREGVAVFKSKGDVDFVITDLKMEGMDGVDVLKEIAALDPNAVTMIMTAFGTVETAVEAMKLGAFDFLTKPFSTEVVRLKVERALELRATRRAKDKIEAQADYLRGEIETRYQFADLVGASPLMQQIFSTIERVAATDASVLICGESGTGKELVARAIHHRSRRAPGPFIKVNCGALTETLLESELFGHEKGSFTGAIKRKLGRFELADGGSLFLDEIGDISPGMQLKLLRALQEREFERVGGERTIKVDVRVLSATNKDLKQEVASGRFREDLYYRLHVVPITLPPLRDRRDDIPLLTSHFLKKLAPRTNPAVRHIDDQALARLMAYSWPGNIRELENAVEQALVFAEGNSLNVTALPPFLRDTSSDDKLDIPRNPQGDMPLPEILDDLEKQLILKAFRKANGVKTETARILGIKTSALYYKLEKYGIE
ncbi:MAG: sigma-54-dependent Fis family transcriptional regulator [Deltaproteobacteria bacterium]|nr:sigma-54-dependent Fis family transcriptional regulator [Deltaproteobacteria bacterium]